MRDHYLSANADAYLDELRERAHEGEAAAAAALLALGNPAAGCYTGQPNKGDDHENA